MMRQDGYWNNSNLFSCHLYTNKMCPNIVSTHNIMIIVYDAYINIDYDIYKHPMFVFFYMYTLFTLNDFLKSFDNIDL